MAIASSLDDTLRNPAETDSSQISRGLTAAVRRGVLPCFSACLTAPIALAITLVWTNPSQALPSGGSDGPPPPPDCIADITGHLTASPSSFNRDTDLSFTTTLSWSVDVPKGCPVSPTVTVAGSPVPTPDHESFTLATAPTPPTTTTVSLVLTSRGLHQTLTTLTIPVTGDPGLIKVSPGREVTADDIAEFNEQWMQPWEIEFWRGSVASTLSNLDSSGMTGNGERMVAMVRMYDLTRDPRYLDHLFDLIEIVLRYRDDRPLGSGPKVTDEIRNKVGLAAWGGGLLDNYGLHSVLELTSSLYAYPIAAFARILAEDPAVRARYQCNIIVFPGLQAASGLQAVPAPQAVAGLQAAIPGRQAAPELKAVAGPQNAIPGTQAAVPELQEVHIPRCADPIFYANRVLETVEVFLPQIRQQDFGKGVEAMLTAPEEYKSRPTKEDCGAAQEIADRIEPARKDRWASEYGDCLKIRDSAGKQAPHNYDLAFSKVLIELSRALVTPFYMQSPARAANAEQMRDFFFALMPRQQRYFVDHLNPQSLKDDYDPCKSHFCWWYMEPATEQIVCTLVNHRESCVRHCQIGGYGCLGYHIEDTDHGSMDMTYLGPFLRDIERLRAAAARVGELYSIGPEQLKGFARAFTDTIAPNTNVTGGNFRSDVAGRQDEHKAPDDADNLCDGWLELTQAEAKVWDLCHEMSLRNVGGQQPYLRIGNHSVLLATKQFLP